MKYTDKYKSILAKRLLEARQSSTPKFERYVAQEAMRLHNEMWEGTRVTNGYIQKSAKRRLGMDEAFYTYLYLDPRKPGRWEYQIKDKQIVLPFKPMYVGKGTRDRMKHHWRHVRNDNRRLIESGGSFYKRLVKIKQLGLEPIIVQASEHDIESIAVVKEMMLIEAIGRKDIGTGVLLNRSAGGDGAGEISEENRLAKSLAWLGRKHTKESRRRMSKTAQKRDADFYKRNMHSEEARAKTREKLKGNTWNRGVKRSEEFKRNLSKMHKGVAKPKGFGAKVSAAKQALASVIVTCPHCGKVGKVIGMKSNHFNNCKQKDS